MKRSQNHRAVQMQTVEGETQQVSEPLMRIDLIEDVRTEIDEDTYEDDRKVDVVVDRLLDEWFPKKLHKKAG